MTFGKRARGAALVAAAALAVTTGCSTKAPDTASQGGGGGGNEGEVTTGEGISGDTIRLGVLTDLTGVFAALGKDITNAHSLYWEEKNADGGVCGTYQVELDVKDTGYVPQNGVKLYSGMRSDILGMQQTIGSPINTALAPSYEEDGIMNIPSAWARNLTDIAGTVVPGSTYDVEMVNGYNYMLDEGLLNEGDTVGHIYFEGEYGANGLKGSQYMADKHGLNVVEAKIKATDQDMTPHITQFKSAGVKMIALTVAPTQLASAATVAESQGLDVPILGSNPVFAPGLLQGPAAAKLKEDLYVVSPVSSFDKHPELLERYQAKFPGGTPSLGVIVGAGMSTMWDVVLEEACSNGDLTREGVQAALEGLESIDTNGLIVPLENIEQGQSPSTQSFILRPADVPGGAEVAKDAFEGEDVAGLD
jgi:ABC-type branched-subunit amino acid transport system substrate-binding protein